MNKKSFNSENEIDLIELSKIIWNGKIKIISIIIIFIVITSIYNQFQDVPEEVQPKKYISTLNVRPLENVNYYKFFTINDYLNSDKLISISQNPNNLNTRVVDNLRITNSSVLIKFFKEILDYEELIYVLKNNKNISKKLSQLTKEEQIEQLQKYTKLLTINSPKDQLSKKLSIYEINLIWNDSKESKEILSQVLELALNNLHYSFFAELEEMWEIKKNDILLNEIKIIEFLEEQSSIAKEVDLKNDYFNNSNVKSSEKYNLSLNIKTNNDTYYLRGFKAIDKEIEIIKQRKNVELYKIKQKISDLKNTDIKWVDFNINFIETRPLDTMPYSKNRHLPLGLAIFMGLIVGIIFVYLNQPKIKR